MAETRPDFVLDEHLGYLDELRESGITNMFSARPHILAEFPYLSEKEAGKVLVYWMHAFGERHSKQETEKKVTVKEKVNKAFKDLRKLGYFAKQNLGDCQSCGWAEVPEGSEKVVFYHDQDSDSWNKDGTLNNKLYLAWAGEGFEIVEVLEKNGLKIEWENQSCENRIAILP